MAQSRPTHSYLNFITPEDLVRYADIRQSRTPQPTKDAELKALFDSPHWTYNQAMALIRAGANPNIKGSYGVALLHYMVGAQFECNGLDPKSLILELVLAYRADINVLNGIGCTPLEEIGPAAVRGNLGECLLMVSLGADISAQHSHTRPFLHQLVNAFRKEYEEKFIAAIKELAIFYKVNFNLKAINNAFTPLQWLMVQDQEKLSSTFALVFIQLGADPNVRVSFTGDSLLHLLVKQDTDESWAVIDELASKHKAQVKGNVLNRDGKSPLDLLMLKSRPTFSGEKFIRLLPLVASSKSVYEIIGIMSEEELITARNKNTPMGKTLRELAVAEEARFPEAPSTKIVERINARLSSNNSSYLLRNMIGDFFHPKTKTTSKAFDWDAALELVKKGADPNICAGVQLRELQTTRASFADIGLMGLFSYGWIRGERPSFQQLETLFVEYGLKCDEPFHKMVNAYVYGPLKNGKQALSPLSLVVHDECYDYVLVFLRNHSSAMVFDLEKNKEISVLDKLVRDISKNPALLSYLPLVLGCGVWLEEENELGNSIIAKWLSEAKVEDITDIMTRVLEGDKKKILIKVSRMPNAKDILWKAVKCENALGKLFSMRELMAACNRVLQIVPVPPPVQLPFFASAERIASASRQIDSPSVELDDPDFGL